MLNRTERREALRFSNNTWKKEKSPKSFKKCKISVDKQDWLVYNSSSRHERGTPKVLMRTAWSLKTIQNQEEREAMIFTSHSKQRQSIRKWVLSLKLNFRFHTGFNTRVWSWLRTNAGGVPNTCKSSGDRGACFSVLAADGWVTREQPALHWGITHRKMC